MATPAQIIANRQNAALSTGPATPAGKQIASKNATRTTSPESSPHSPTKTAPISKPSPPRFAASSTRKARTRPSSSTRWSRPAARLHRIQRLEDHAYEQILTEPGSAADPDARILSAIGQSGNLLDKIHRYRAAAERSYYKALRELQSSRVRTHRAEANALDAYIKKIIFAPVPGEYQRKLYHAAVNQVAAEHASLQNEPNPSAAPVRSSRRRRSHYPENLRPVPVSASPKRSVGVQKNEPERRAARLISGHIGIKDTASSKSQRVHHNILTIKREGHEIMCATRFTTGLWTVYYSCILPRVK